MSAALSRISCLVIVCGLFYVSSWTVQAVLSKESDSETPGSPVPVDTIPSTPNDSENEGTGNPLLQAVGVLGIGHIQSTLGFIGVTADAFSTKTYDAKKVEDLMMGTINGIDAVKTPLRKLQETHLSDDDGEFIDRMIVTYESLQREAKALTNFARSRKTSDQEAFAKARRVALKKLEQLTEADQTTDAKDRNIDAIDPDPGN